MATAGTLLSDLDGKPPVLSNKDDDLVNKILADMNLKILSCFSRCRITCSSDVMMMLEISASIQR